jgi:PleD family two-component response regulator
MKGSVLVIDSDSPQVGDLNEMLRRAGYRVEVASHPLTGADVPIGTRAIVLLVSDPYWRI